MRRSAAEEAYERIARPRLAEGKRRGHSQVLGNILRADLRCPYGVHVFEGVKSNSKKYLGIREIGTCYLN